MRFDTFTFITGVAPNWQSEVEGRLASFNEQHAPLWSENHDGQFEQLPLQVYVCDDSDRLVGGLVARTHAIRSWLEVLLLWVDEDCRGLRLGHKLMEHAEQEARLRGCKYARLASSDYQAPEFYKSLGYRLYGELKNCPPGDIAFYFWKDLITT